MDKDMVHTHNEHYSAIKRNETVPFTETWMDLETSDRVNSENKYHINTYVESRRPYRCIYLQSGNRDRQRTHT